LLVVVEVAQPDMAVEEEVDKSNHCQTKLFLVMYPSPLVQEGRQVLAELVHQLPLCNPIRWHMVKILVVMVKIQVLVHY
jgi:hypothetical protein